MAMKIKKFKAQTVKEALLLVKAELGPNAVILNSRRLKGPLLPAFGKDSYEVTAALDESAYAMPEQACADEGVATRPAKSVQAYAPRKVETAVAIAELDREKKEKVLPSGLSFEHFAPPAPPANTDGNFSVLRQDIDTMRGALTSLVTSLPDAADQRLGKGLRAIKKELEESEVHAAHIDEIITAIRQRSSDEDTGSISRMFREAQVMIEKGITVSGYSAAQKKGRALKIAMIGPTGVGKTTSIAKLASHFKLKEKLNIALVAADNYRIAAIEQIQTFAAIASIPVEIVFNEEEMERALKKFSGFDMIFIDTAGRSQRNAEHMSDLKRMMAAIHADEVHLVLSITTKQSDLREITRRYADASYDRILCTKLDETERFGPLYNLCRDTGMPLSYISTGQNVPDDIAAATSHALARLIIGGGDA